ncbi:MAG: gluconate 2-dehydrogenase subunit 3 family protein [Steroidobacteraceae bacterium]
MDRRDAIRLIGAWLGGAALVGGSGLLAALDQAHAAVATDPTVAPVGAFSAAQITLLDEIAETMLPATRTPGAKAAQTGAFMARMVSDTYSAAERQIFLDGLRNIDAAMRTAHGVSFMEATPAQRLALLTVLDREQKHVMDDQAAADKGRASAGERRSVPYFRMMKELALLGFFTSEVGCTQVLRYIESPGRYESCVPYVRGAPAWAEHA